jgi:protocatechuate 3,4-dioxygenase beta subunit
MRLVEADGSASAGALVYFYHTGADGDYGPNDAEVPPASDNNYARLFGYATTDSDGTIEFQTIRPGGYPDSDIPEHIHLRIWCPGRPSFGGEIWFRDDSRIGPEDLEEAARIPRIVICPVSTDADGNASIEATIRLD